MNDNQFDKLIRDALAGDPAPQQLARLEAFWQDRFSADRQRRARRSVALAACVTLVIGAAARFVLSPTEKHPVTPSRQLVDATPIRHPRGSREPTAYETVLFALGEARERPPHDALLAQLRRATTDARRRELIRRIGRTGGVAAAQPLLDAARKPALRDAALDAVEAIVDLEGMANLVATAPTDDVRQALMTRIISDGSNLLAASQLLAMVGNPATRDQALEIATAALQLPVDELVSAFDDGEARTRLAAAMILSRAGDAAIDDALIARVAGRQRSPVEVWVALLARRGPAIDEFLGTMQGEPHVLAQVNKAQAYYARLTP